jgi:hypothetical protein
MVKKTVTSKLNLIAISTVVLLLFLCLAPLAQAATVTVTVDGDQIAFPALTLERGMVSETELEDAEHINDYVKSAEARLGFVTSWRELHQDHTALSENYCGSPLAEFYSDGGVIKSRQDSNWSSMRDRAEQNRMLLVNQLCGTPDEGGTPLFTIDPNYFWNGNANYYPIPIPQEFELYGNVIGDWAIGADNLSNYPTIWMGNQEPEHTVGYIDESDPPDGIGDKDPDSEQKRTENIQRYTKCWTKVANRIRAHNRDAMLGAIQTNGGANFKIPVSIDEIEAQNCPIDFYTIQNYDGENNSDHLETCRSSMSSYFSTVPIMFNRYTASNEGVPIDKDLADDMVRWLTSERYLVDQADIYGYAYKTGYLEKQTMAHDMVAFLNLMPAQRRPISISGTDISGFASGNALGVYAVLWNASGGSNQDIILELNNLPPAAAGNWDTYELEVLKGVGTATGLSAVSASLTQTGADDYEIDGFSLEADTFALVRLDAGAAYLADADLIELDQLTYTRFDIWNDSAWGTTQSPSGQGHYDVRTAQLTVAAETASAIGLAGVTFRDVPVNRQIDLLLSFEGLPATGDGSTVLEIRIDYLDGDSVLKSVFVCPDGFEHAHENYWDGLDWKALGTVEAYSQYIADDLRFSFDIGDNDPAGWAGAADRDRGIMLSLLLNNAPATAAVRARLSDLTPNGDCVLVPDTIPSDPGGGGEVYLPATDDTYVQMVNPDTNYGSSSILKIRDNATRYGLVMFDTDGAISGATVQSATLSLTASDADLLDPSVHGCADTTWDEMTVTWNTMPTMGSLIDTVTGSISQGQTVQFDVTSEISGDGEYAFYLQTASTTAGTYSSREDSAYANPTLHIVYSGGGGNSAPTFDVGSFFETEAMENASYSSSLADNASDPDSDPLTFSKISGPSWLSVAANGDLSGTPGAGDVGDNTFTVRVEDSSALSDDATIYVTVRPLGWTNSPPVFAADPFSKTEAFPTQAYSNQRISDDVSDPDGDLLTFSKISGPSWLSVASKGGLLSGTPLIGDLGLNTFTVRVTDSGGLYDEATMNITVDPLTFYPVDDSFVKFNSPTVNYGSEATIEIRGSGANQRIGFAKFDVSGTSDITAATLKLYYTYDNAAALADTTVSQVSDNSWTEGTITWDTQPAIGTAIDTQLNIPVAAWAEFDVTDYVTGNGTYSFAIQTTIGARYYYSSKEGTFAPRLTISEGTSNQPPTFTVDPINETDATEDAAYNSTLADDASDPESDPLTFSKVSGPAWLNVAANGNLSGTPANGDVGLNVFTVQVDATGGSDTATLNITVLNTNDDPTFTADPIVETNATEDAAYSSTIGDDATDPDVGDTLFFSKVTGPAWLIVAGDGTLSGTPANGDVGLNSWTVQVDDDLASIDQATLEITVDAAGGQLPGQASNPSPSNGAKKVQNPTLSWTAGTDATSHDVYFGTDSTPDSGEFQGNQAGTTFDPGSLSKKTNYYWRIDEVNAQGTTTGTVWTFKTK